MGVGAAAAVDCVGLFAHFFFLSFFSCCGLVVVVGGLGVS